MMTSKPKNDLDMISNLPDPILEIILSGIPAIEEVVRTSVLSRRWRYLWTIIPSFSSLDINCSRRLNPHKTNFERQKFKKFVTWALEGKFHLDLESFRLCCLSYYSRFIVKRWIQTAVQRNVKLLDLMFCPRDNWGRIIFHHFVETSDSLESLRLDLFGQTLSLESCARFTSLKVFELNKVRFNDYNVVEQFLKSSPLLEDLSLIDCYMGAISPLWISHRKLKTLGVFYCKTDEEFRGLVLSCPKLMVFEYVNCSKAPLIFENLESLKNVVILPQDNPKKNNSPNLGNSICQLLSEISHVESLSLNLYFIQEIDAAHDLKQNFPASFPNLKKLELTTTLDAFTMKVIIRILIFSPSLESLNLIIQKRSITPKNWWDLFKFGTRRILTRHLKRVEFLEFNGEKRKLDIVRLLLEHGKALEEMVFTWYDKEKYQENSTKTINRVSRFPKASATVKLIALLKIPQRLFNSEPGPGCSTILVQL